MEISKLAKQFIYWPEIKNPYQENIDISNVTIQELLPLFYKHLNAPKTEITDHLIKFYTLNESLSNIRIQENNILNQNSIELYNQYLQEIHVLSQKMLAYLFTICVNEAKHSSDIDIIAGDIAEYKEDMHTLFPNDNLQEINRKTTQGIDHIFKNCIQYSYKRFLDKTEYSAFKNTFSFVIDYNQASNNNRIKAPMLLLPLMEKEPYINLTIQEFLKSLVAIFSAKDNFEESYGGKPWAQIAQHALNFVSGNINAEVFIDQTFSLEHNGGQIFNKEVIFHHADNINLYSHEIEYEDTFEYKVPLINFLLNLQHDGLLMSFFNHEYHPHSISSYKNKQSYHSLIEEKLFSKKTFDNTVAQEEHYQDYLNTLKNLNDNIKTFYTVKNNFNSRNPDFINFLNGFNFSVKPLNLYNNFKTLEKQYPDEFYCTDDLRYYHLLSNLIEQKSNIHSLDISQDKFHFSYYDTKNVPITKAKKEILGNKALGLMQMQKLGIPVPQAWVFPAENAQSFLKFEEQWIDALPKALNKMNKHFISKDGNPVLCSVRSGSAVSMPGMMDTILNVGLDDSNYDYFCQKLGMEVVNKCAIKFMELFTQSYCSKNILYSNNLDEALKQFKKNLKQKNISFNSKNYFPLDKDTQYTLCLKAVFKSWNNERAIHYRNHNQLSHKTGSAAIIQQMVFGNLNKKSCTGVVFSRDCISGNKGIIGEFLINAQGEDVVAGNITPKNIRELKNFSPKIFKELNNICAQLEKHTGEIQDIEFTVENNQLYILQTRNAVCSSFAQLKLNQEKLERGEINQKQFLSYIKNEHILPTSQIDNQQHSSIAQGLIASPGIMRGIVIEKESDIKKYSTIYNNHYQEDNFGWIFYAPLTNPEHVSLMTKTHAFVTSHGGFTSHAAILSRSWQKPCIVGIEQSLKSGMLVTLDGYSGKIYEGLLPVITHNSISAKKVIKNILDYHQIDNHNLKQLTQELSSSLDKINQATSWMESYPKHNKNKDINKQNDKFKNFLSIGEKLALLLVQSQNSNIKVKL